MGSLVSLVSLVSFDSFFDLLVDFASVFLGDEGVVSEVGVGVVGVGGGT